MSFSRSLKARAHDIWEACYQHPFVQRLGQGTLDKETFTFYLLQDYLYLIEYAKVFAMGAVKAHDEATMLNFSRIQYFTLEKEMDVHRRYMADFGISTETVRQVRSALYNRTYTANMQAIGATGDLASLLAAVLPCAWTYADFAVRLKREYGDGLADNIYRSWIETYAGEAFADSFVWIFDTLDALVSGKNEQEKERLVRIFISCMEFEYLFWDMAYKREMGFKL